MSWIWWSRWWWYQIIQSNLTIHLPPLFLSYMNNIKKKFDQVDYNGLHSITLEIIFLNYLWLFIYTYVITCNWFYCITTLSVNSIVQHSHLTARLYVWVIHFFGRCRSMPIFTKSIFTMVWQFLFIFLPKSLDRCLSLF